MKRIVLILAMGLLLSACSGSANGDVTQTLNGQLLGGNSGYVLMTDDGETVSLESNLVDLDKYVGGKVSVTGQFSGSTLYVDKVDQ